jgi:hypothetical protein
VCEYLQVLARMRRGDSERDISSANRMVHGKLKTVRRGTLPRGWLDPRRTMPNWR